MSVSFTRILTPKVCDDIIGKLQEDNIPEDAIEFLQDLKEMLEAGAVSEAEVTITAGRQW